MFLDKMGGQGNITKNDLTVISESNTNEHQILANTTHYELCIKNWIFVWLFEFDAKFTSLWDYCKLP